MKNHLRQPKQMVSVDEYAMRYRYHPDCACEACEVVMKLAMEIAAFMKLRHGDRS